MVYLPMAHVQICESLSEWSRTLHLLVRSRCVDSVTECCSLQVVEKRRISVFRLISEIAVGLIVKLLYQDFRET